MKIKKFLPICLFCVSLFSVSCNNDIELIAPYQEIGVIYGLLNPSDSIHYVRVQKAFLGEGNALVMAQNPDSIYYPDILDVQMVEISNGTPVGAFPLSRIIGPPKDPGTFPSTPNILYQTNGEVLNRESEYRIVVKNNETGYIFYAQTTIVDSIRVLRPSINEQIRWANPNPVFVEYVPTPNGRVYNLVIRFKYIEETINTGVLEQKYIDWVFPNEVVNNPQSISTIQLRIDGENFYKFVAGRLNPDASVKRFAGPLDFIFTAGAEFLANYVSINQSTTSILTSPPEYSNVTGGAGIFSSRFIQVEENRNMDNLSLDSLKIGQYTGDLGFQ